MSNKMLYTDASGPGAVDMHGRRCVSPRQCDAPRIYAWRRFGAGRNLGHSFVSLARSIYAEMTTAAANKKKLVVIFQRGAMDGLKLRGAVRGKRNYYAMRPNDCAEAERPFRPQTVFFGLHPAMASFKPLYDQGTSRPSSTPPVLPPPRARTLTRRTTWSPGHAPT